MPAYVINLAHRTQRLARFRQRFVPLESQFDLHILRATNKSDASELLANGTVRIKPNYVDPVWKRVMKLGEVGCIHSHFRAWQAIANDEQHEWGAIFEDDAVFVDDFAARRNQTHEALFDIVFYSHKKMASTEPEDLGHGLETFVHSYWTLGYALSRNAAKELVRTTSLQNLVPADEYLSAMLVREQCDVAGVCDRCCTLKAASYSHLLASPENFAGDFSDTESSSLAPSAVELSFLLVTVATDTSHAGYRALARSAEHFGVPLETLAAGQDWRGGEMAVGPGGGHKLNEMRSFVASLPADQLVVFTDGYDTLLIRSAAEVDALLRELVPPGTVVFAAERACWPDEELEIKYPIVDTPYRFLNSGNYAGRAGDIAAILRLWDANAPSADDQRYMTARFLLRDVPGVQIQLDYERRLFHPLAFIPDDEWSMGDAGRSFTRTDGKPVAALLHGNGPAKILLQQIANYEAGAWSEFYGSMWHSRRWLEDSDAYVLTQHHVLVAAFCRDTPFLDQFEHYLRAMKLPAERTSLFAWHCPSTFSVSRAALRNVIRFETMDITFARIKALAAARKFGATHVLFVDSAIFLTRPNTVADLLRDDLPLVVPHVQHPGGVDTNYWPGTAPNGWYAQLFSTQPLYSRAHTGLWHVPFVMDVSLVRADAFDSVEAALEKCVGSSEDRDVCVCRNLRNAGVDMVVDNTQWFGEMLVNATRAHSGYSASPDLFEAVNNPVPWDRAYLADEFRRGVAVMSQPCPDVFSVVTFNERFCRELVAETERMNKWSSGDHEDERLAGGYENVPTQDIHLNQFEWEEQWVAILRRHFYPLFYQEFVGTTLKEDINIAFVVRYTMDGQKELRAHQDAAAISTVTALSNNFTGGGTFFTRYDCTVRPEAIGTTSFHPSLVTHQHAGLAITSGTRYILVSFNQ